MITCLPQSLCSWDYRLLGTRTGDAGVTFNAMSKQGTLTLGHSQYDIRKESILVSRWTLETRGEVMGNAEKISLFRKFQLQTAGPALTLEGAPLSSTYRMIANGREVGTIQKMHPFTRRATIDCSEAINELDQIFAFWIAAMMWREASRD